MPPGPRIVEEVRRPRQHDVQLSGEENRAEARQEPPSSPAHPRFSLVPSLGTLLRIGLAAAFLLSVQSASERLAWRSNGLPFGATYDHSTGRVAVNDFASIFGLAKAVIGGAIERPYSEAGQLQFME